jgi:hypothetical protein
MKKLNGWQRIFIVFAVIWIPIVFLTINKDMPVDPSLYVERVLAVERALEKKAQIESAVTKAQAAGDTNAVNVLLEAARKIESDPYASAFDASLGFLRGKKIDYIVSDGTKLVLDSTSNQKQAQAAYLKALPEIRSAKQKVIFDYWANVAMGYFLPLLVIYLFGWSIGWIRRGFKS